MALCCSHENLPCQRGYSTGSLHPACSPGCTQSTSCAGNPAERLNTQPCLGSIRGCVQHCLCPSTTDFCSPNKPSSSSPSPVQPQKLCSRGFGAPLEQWCSGRGSEGWWPQVQNYEMGTTSQPTAGSLSMAELLKPSGATGRQAAPGPSLQG